MIYIKPWDRTVFENFFVCLSTINELMDKYTLPLDVYVMQELADQFNKET